LECDIRQLLVGRLLSGVRAIAHTIEHLAGPLGRFIKLAARHALLAIDLLRAACARGRNPKMIRVKQALSYWNRGEPNVI